jgi:FkbM family methyltransferase
VTLELPVRGDPLASLIADGDYEVPTAHAIVLDMLSPGGGLLLDVGAHLGTLAVPAALLGSRVVAVEANPHNAAILRANGAGLPLEVVEAAAGDDGSASVRFLPDGPYGRIVRRGRGSIEVPIVTGAQLLRRLGGAPDIVKIDVEGSEIEVLRGLAPVLAHRPPLVFEANAYALDLRGRHVDDLHRAVEAMGYEIYRIEPDLLVPVGSTTFQARSWIDCLAVPAGVPVGTLTSLPIGTRPTAGDIAGDVFVGAREPLSTTRAWLAAALAGAPDDLHADPRVVEALELLADDPDRAVRRAAHRTRRVRRAR